MKAKPAGTKLYVANGKSTVYHVTTGKLGPTRFGGVMSELECKNDAMRGLTEATDEQAEAKGLTICHKCAASLHRKVAKLG